MKEFLLILLVGFTAITACAQQPRQIENLATFAKLYGYVRYFHPSDEAATVDWDRFAIYGVQQVENAKNSEDLRQRLEDLFFPVAPTLKLYRSDGSVPGFSLPEITPPNTFGYKIVAWQHLGVGLGNENNIYRSSRINRPSVYQESGQSFGTTGEMIDVEKYRGKDFVLSAKLKIANGPGTGHLWARVDIDQRTGFFDKMTNRPVKEGQEWTSYEIKGKIDKDADKLAFGIYLLGKGTLLADDFVLQIKEEKEWITVHSNGFEKDYSGTIKDLNKTQAGYLFSINDTASDNNPCLSITDDPVNGKATFPDRPFSRHAQAGEYIDKPIGSNLSCIVPLALYGTEDSTFPQVERAALNSLNDEISSIPVSSMNGENHYTRLANLVITWNIFQHFYPYFDVIDTNWEEEFRKALSDAYDDRTDFDFLKTLQKFTAGLKDGHVYVSAFASTREAFFPPIEWEWIENKLVITHVMGDSIPLQTGDIVTSINDQAPGSYFEKVQSYISAASKGWLDYRAKSASLRGSENSVMVVRVSKSNGAEAQVPLVRNLLRADYSAALPQKQISREISPGIIYLNIDAASNNDIKNLMPRLGKARGIICDLRGYPKSGPEFISHFLHQKDTSSMWMRVPQIIYPDQEKISGYRVSGWNMSPQQPRLDARVVFITDGSAISYAESYMSFIKHYKLATIVGQPTAGTNGNINPFVLPGGYQVSWTGMKVLKHDGSRHHGIGVIPDVFVEKTIAGIRQGRDEFLEKAIEIVSQH